MDLPPRSGPRFRHRYPARRAESRVTDPGEDWPESGDARDAARRTALVARIACRGVRGRRDRSEEEKKAMTEWHEMRMGRPQDADQRMGSKEKDRMRELDTHGVGSSWA
jgi:hypothetical protein